MAVHEITTLHVVHCRLRYRYERHDVSEPNFTALIR